MKRVNYVRKSYSPGKIEIPKKKVKEPRFDKILWRINGLIFLGLAVMAAVVLGYFSYNIIREKLSQRHVGNIVNVNSETPKKESIHLGVFSHIGGREYFICPIFAEQSYNRSYYSKSASSIRNYLFYHTATSQSHWLLESNDWLISEIREIYENPVTERPGQVNAYVYQIIERDSNGDGLLNRDDRVSVYISDYKGQELKRVLPDAEEVFGVEQVNTNSIVIFYSKGDKSFAHTIDYRSGTILSHVDLPVPVGSLQ